MSKLTEQQVFEIKYENDGVSHKDLCEKYGISKDCIRDIRRGITWKHVVSNLPVTKRIKISMDQANEIRENKSCLMVSELAQAYGVPINTIKNIRNKKTYVPL